MALENTATDLYNELVTRNLDPEVTDEMGKDSQPADGKVFSFDYVAGSGRNYGTVVIVLGQDNEMLMFYGDNLGKGMDPEDKREWFDDFLPNMKQFAVRHGLDRFSPQDLYRLKHSMATMSQIKEGLFESFYGTRRVSYTGEATQARLMIRHSRPLSETDVRYRNIESMFIETAEGERWKLPFAHLAGGRAMLEHVRQGGRPYDLRGVHIAEMVNELKVLSRFNRASAGRVLEGVSQEITEQAREYYETIKSSLHSMASTRGYSRYFEAWQPAEVTAADALVEDLRTLFVEQTIDQRIEAALPVLAKIKGTTMKEADIFESWATAITEGTWAVPDTPGKVKALQDFMTKEQPVGADAVNATTALYNIIGNDDLFDRLSVLANDDPEADARAVVKDWLRDNAFDYGLEDVLAMIDNEPGEIAVDNEDATNEATVRRIQGPHGELERTDTETGTTVQRVKYSSDDHAPGARLAYPPEGVPASTHGHRGYRAPLDSLYDIDEGDNLATFSGPTESAECNQTMEGEHCPVHGMMECGMYEDSTDPMDHRGAVTDSFYEALERLKSLALPK